MTTSRPSFEIESPGEERLAPVDVEFAGDRDRVLVDDDACSPDGSAGES